MSQGFAKPSFILYTLIAIFAVGSCSLLQSAWAQKKKTEKSAKESYTRPAPTRPIKPTIPSADRYQEDKVFLEYADSLYRPANEFEEFQIVKGAVKFRQGGMWMFCDSAYYYPAKNSLDAFGHVEMRQGDTLFVYADKLFYDGLSKHATLTHGPSRGNVELKNRSVTLVTDSLDYDVNSQLGWYTTGGQLDDDVNTLTSIYGEYSPSTKVARFRNDVLLVNRKDGYRLITDELEYNTSTHIADINSTTRIEGANDTIYTTRGWYNTTTDHAQLTARSTIVHRDSSSNVTTLEGDSIIYDRISHISRAFMFRDAAKHKAPMILTDTARKVILIGGYGEYNDSTRSAYSTEYPLLMEFSRPDTLFLRADTIFSFIETERIDTIPPSPSLQEDNEVSPDLTDFINIPNDSISPADSIPSADTIPSADSISLGDSISPPATPLISDSVAKAPPREFHVARAIGCARFFNQDIQGVADTLLFKEQDSILYMFRKPIIWSGERQVYGNRIDVHFNDSTPDWALLPNAGMLAEYIEEDFYNQLTGSRMKAFLENKNLKRLEVEGNVIAILLPQEKDSSYNKLVHAESSYLTLDMDGKEMKHLIMWPEVSGTVTPLFEVKKSEQYIEGFRWLEALRPKRSWYGDRLHWVDELGDIPDELLQYFKEPELFKNVQKPNPASMRRGNKPSMSRSQLLK
ncbi:MAG: OstA-like protein [Muribaculaceae bacterium]|nr:OstA-like protein [Muribaculaceae bacterium]